MLYKKNSTETLSEELFKNPTSEYRGTPFWSWNGKLNKEELLEQIDQLESMGFGGFHMHVRTGMDTPYLSDEFKELICACTQKAKEKQMIAWLYDEDRWPSGAAGGFVTKNYAYRQRHLLFTKLPYQPNETAHDPNSSRADASRQGNGTLIAKYDVQLNDDGTLHQYFKIDDESQAHGTIYYAYVEVATNSTWFNNQAYVNTLDKNAIDCFIDKTYNFYLNAVGQEFGKTIPSIFTDEPQFSRKNALRFANSTDDITLPWTDDLDTTFSQKYGTSLIDHIPELIWDLKETPSQIRYQYHDHVADRFTQAFADNCGNWCKEHGIALTGHMMDEPTLFSQTKSLGEAMRSYRAFELPGIDMLCANFEFTTAKQCQSAVHQYGREGMLSELYGVTGWNFDFRGHKIHGDWQAALGVTIRVPHLAWYTMKGEAKRDYPAAISYQSPWYKEYSEVENHFARVATAMTRGKPCVKIGVIHPIESYWLHWGPAEQTDAARNQLDNNFQNITSWLLKGMLDFDFISESLFPDLCPNVDNPIQVGKMSYDVIIVPGCETLRSTTLDRLEKFKACGGNVLFLGKAPAFENAQPSQRPLKLYNECQTISFEKKETLCALEPYRTINVFDLSTGSITNNLIHQLREDNDGKWIFIAHAVNPNNVDISRKQDIRIEINGEYSVLLYNTLTGDITETASTVKNGKTIIHAEIFDCDSLLYKLLPQKTGTSSAKEPVSPITKRINVPNLVSYTLSEKNVLLLDEAEYALDMEEWRPKEELLRADNVLRKELGYPLRGQHVAQPWAVVPEQPHHRIRLKFRFNSEIRTIPYLALEDSDKAEIILNGKQVSINDCGYFVDKSIRKVLIPAIRKGENVLEITIPFGPNTNTEWIYLLGDFAVNVNGEEATLKALPEKVSFTDITQQGFPFYSGEFKYHIPAPNGTIHLRLPRFRASLCIAETDESRKRICFPPYKTTLKNKNNLLTLTAFIPRTNAFGPLHSTIRENMDPGSWRRTGDFWSYQYNFYPQGIIEKPQISQEE